MGKSREIIKDTSKDFMKTLCKFNLNTPGLSWPLGPYYCSGGVLVHDKGF